MIYQPYKGPEDAQAQVVCRVGSADAKGTDIRRARTICMQYGTILICRRDVYFGSKLFRI